MPGTISQVRNTVGRGEVKSTNVYRCRTLATPERNRPIAAKGFPLSIAEAADWSAKVIITSIGLRTMTTLLGLYSMKSANRPSDAPAITANIAAKVSARQTRRTSLTGADAAMASLSWDQVRGQSAAALRVTAGRQPAPLLMLQATLGRCCSKIRWKRLRGRRTAESTAEAPQSAGLHESCSPGQVRRALRRRRLRAGARSFVVLRPQ